jgi:uracil phosphoribosyltransferase
MNHNLHVVRHPLIDHKLHYMRDRKQPPSEFRRLLKEVGSLMALDVSASVFETHKKTKQIETHFSLPGQAPLCQREVLDGSKIVIVPILRAGLVLADGLHEMMPFAGLGHLGLHQNSSHTETQEYLVKLPNPTEKAFILVDPMIGTSNTAARAIQILRICGVDDANIRFVGLLAGEGGAEKLTSDYPNVHIYVAGVDPEVNDAGRVVPGVGVISERLYGL